MSAQHPSDDSRMGEVRFRVPLPLLIPILSLLIIGGLAVGMSQVFLNLPKEAAVIIAMVTAANLLGAGAYIAIRSRVGSQTMFELLAIVAYPVLIGVVIAATGFGGGAAHGEEGGHGGGGGGAPAPEADVVVHSENIAFDVNQLELPARSTSTVALVNDDSVEHNISIYPDQAAGLGFENAIFEGEIIQGGQSTTYEIDTPKAGNYYFQCDVHPNMSGDVVVE